MATPVRVNRPYTPLQGYLPLMGVTPNDPYEKILEPVDIKHSVEVVDFVLEDDGCEARDSIAD